MSSLVKKKVTGHPLLCASFLDKVFFHEKQTISISLAALLSSLVNNNKQQQSHIIA